MSSRRVLAFSIVAAVVLAMLPVTASPALAADPPVIVNSAAQERWLNTFSIVKPNSNCTRVLACTLAGTFLVKHDPATTVSGLKIDQDWNGTDNTAAAAVTTTGVTVSKLPGTINYSRVTFSFTPASAGLPSGGGPNAPIRFMVAMSDAQVSAVVNGNVHFTQQNNQTLTTDYPHMYNQSQTATEVAPGTPVNFSFQCEDSDSSDDCRGVQWRTRRLNDAVTTAETTQTTTTTGGATQITDNATVTVSNISFPQRGRYVVEGRLRNGGSGTGSITDTSTAPQPYFRLGVVDVNTLTGSPTASLSAPATVDQPNTFTVTATTNDTDTTGKVQVIDWDVDGNATNGPLGDGYEQREYIADEATGTLSAAQLSRDVDASTLPTGSVTLRARVTDNGAMTASDPIRREATATTDIYVNPPDLTVTKDDGTATLATGGSTTYTVVATNNGVGDAPDVTVADTLPLGLTPTSADGGPDWSCGIASQTVTCTHGTLAASTTAAAITITASVGGDAPNSIANTANVSSSATDRSMADNSATDTDTVDRPDVAIAKTGPATVDAGGSASYTIDVSNVGVLSTFGDVTVTDTLPSGLAYTASSGTDWSCSPAGQVVTCTNPGPLAAAGSLATLTIDASVDAEAPASVTNNATVDADGDNTPANNSASAGSTVNHPDLTITKTAAGPFSVGQNSSYDLAVTNVGTLGTLGTITVVDTLPTGLTYTGFTGTGWSCALAGPVVTCDNAGPAAAGGGTLPMLTLQVNAALNAPALLANTASVDTSGDINAANDSATASTTVTGPDLALTKTHAGDFFAGQNGDYTLGIQNVGDSASFDTVTVADSLPAGLTFVSGTGTGWTCSAAGQDVTCTSTDPIAPTASSAITLTVGADTSAIPGVTNTATVATSGDRYSTNDTASDPTVVVGTVDLAITKSDAGAEFFVGHQGTYTLDVTNIGNDATADPVTVIDNLPSGLAFVSGTGTDWSCSSVDPLVTCVRNTPIAAGTSTQITLTVAVSAAGLPGVTNSATVSTPADVSSANDTATDNTSVFRDAEIQVDAPDAIARTDEGDVVSSVSNTDGKPRSNVRVNITVEGPAPFSGPRSDIFTITKVDGSTNTQGVNDTFQLVGGKYVGEWGPHTGFPLPSGAFNSNTFTTQIAPNAPLGNYTITTDLVEVDGTGAVTSTLATDADTLRVAALPTVDVTTPPTFYKGVADDITSSVSNADGIDYARTRFNITLEGPAPFTDPPGDVFLVTHVNGSTDTQGINDTFQLVGGKYVGEWGPHTGFPIPQGFSASTSFTVVFQNGADAGSYTVTVDLVTVDNTGAVLQTRATDSSSSLVAETPDLDVDKSHAGAFSTGTQGTYTIGVSNIGTGPTTGMITVTDPLPAGLDYVGATGTGWTCSLGIGEIVTCTNPGPIASGAAADPITLTVDTTTTAVPGVTNNVVVITTNDLNGTNDSDTDPTVVATPDLVLDKAHSGDFTTGTQGTWTIDVTNPGDGMTSGAITVTDTIPAGTDLVSVSGSGWSCSNFVSAITCTNPGPVASGGSLPTITIVADVHAAAYPAVTNTANVSTPQEAVTANNGDSDPTTVRSPDLVVDKAHGADFETGTQGSYTLDVTNQGDGSTSGEITLVDTVPAGTTFVSATGSGWSCAESSGTVTCTNPGPVAAGAALPTITLVSDVLAGAFPSITNTAAVSTPEEGVTNNNGDSDPTIVRSPDLVVDKSHTGSFATGTTGTYDIDVSNSGNSSTTGAMSLSDTLPNGLTPQTAAGSGWSCAIAGQAVTCTNPGPLGAGASLPTVTIEVAVGPAAAGGVTNTASVTTSEEAVTNNNSDTDLTTVLAPDLQITKVGTGTFATGTTGNYTLDVSNEGTSSTTGTITVTDVLPAGLREVSTTASGWTCNVVDLGTRDEVTCTVPGPLANGSALPTISIDVAVGGAAYPNVTNTATVETFGDPNAGNDTSNSVVTVDSPDLVVDKAAVAAFETGTNGQYTIDVTNNGTSTTTGTIAVSDTLPAGITYVSAAGSGWACSETSGTVTCTNPGPLAAASSLPTITIDVAVAANAFPAVSNSASASTPDEGPSANNADTVLTAVAGPDLVVAKSHTGDFATEGPGSFSIVVTNQGNSTTTGPITVTDTLPGGLAHVASGGTGWACSEASGTVTCTNPGPVAPAASLDPITLDVTVGVGAHPSVTNAATASTNEEPNTANNTGTDTATVIAPDLAVSKSHTGVFTVGVTADYVLTVNNVGTNSTVGTITLTDTLPAGITPTGVDADPAWSCSISGQDVTCTTAGPLATASSLPAVTVHVVADNTAVPGVTNSVSVSTPGDPNAGNDTANDPTTVNGAPDLSLAKTHTGTLTEGVDATYTVTASNVGDGPTIGTTTLTDTLPAGLSYVSATGSGWVCNESTGTVTCTTAAIAAEAESLPPVSITVNPTLAAVPFVTNTASVSTPGDSDSGNDSASDPTSVNPKPDLSIAKTHPGVFTVGVEGVYTIAVENVGDGPTIAGITVTDTLPAGLAFTNVAASGWTCSHFMAEVTCDYSGVIAAHSPAPPITLTVTPSGVAVPSVTNEASVSTQADTNAANDLSSDPTTVDPAPDMTIAKTHTGNFTAGSNGVYTITATNLSTGPTIAPVTVTDPLPNGYTFVSAAGTGWSCAAASGVVTCTHAGVIAGGASADPISLTVSVSPIAVPTRTNTATVSTFADAVSSNNSASDVTGVNPSAGPNLEITKTHSGIFTPGVNGVYTIGVTNIGSGSTTGTTTVTDTLPAGFGYVSATGANWNCSFIAGTLTCSRLNAIAAGAAAPNITLTVTVAQSTAPQRTNVATVSTAGDTAPANNTASDVTVVAAPDLSMTKTHSGNFAEGVQGSYTITVANGGTAPTTGTITVVDTIPSGLGYVSSSGTGWTCSSLITVVTCTRPGPIANGSSAPPITLTVLPAFGSAPGVTNTATVSTPNDYDPGNNLASDPTSITPAAPPDMAITKTHVGNFGVNVNGVYTIGVSNVGSGPALGTITVQDSLPPGLTYVSASGTGWSCGEAAGLVTCTRSGPLAAGASAPPISLTVLAGAGAIPGVTNTATVAADNDSNAANDSASDPTTVGSVPPNTNPVIAIGGYVTIPGKNGGTATVSFNIRRTSFCTVFLYTGSARVIDASTNTNINVLVFGTNSAVTRTGTNGAHVIGFGFNQRFQSGSFTVDVDDKSSVGLGPDTVSVNAGGILNYVHSGSATSGNVTVY